MNHFEYYVFALIVLIVGFLIVKKVATCLFKTVVTVVVLAILAGIYFLACRKNEAGFVRQRSSLR